MFKCPVCGKKVDPVESNGYYVCPNCGYVFDDIPLFDDSPVEFTKEGEVRITHTPAYSNVTVRAVSDMKPSFSYDFANEVEAVKQCIMRKLSNVRQGSRKIGQKWLVIEILNTINEHPEKKLSKSALLRRLNEKRKKNSYKIVSVALSYICGSCVECIP